MKFIILFVVLMPCLAVKDRNPVVFNDVMYFSDNTAPMTFEQGREYCKEQGGELARVANKPVFDVVRLKSKVGSYWIDGKETADVWRFQFNYDCSLPNGMDWWNTQGILTEIKSLSCMSLVKGTTLANSYLESGLCSEEKAVICQYPMNGCTQFDNSTTTLATGR